VEARIEECLPEIEALMLAGRHEEADKLVHSRP